MTLLRSLLFNLLYYGLTLVLALLLLPVLMIPSPYYWAIMRQYFFFVRGLSKYVLGLDFTPKGTQHLPRTGGYIIAAKHQSAYETLMLPVLFAHPVVVLKQELLNIPLWGWFAARAGMIGIDRANPREAMPRMIAGVKHAIERNRTVVIFPQGTRVAVHDTPDQRPYKRGIYELYAATNVPVIPMALNTGLYWPRNAFFKRAGRATFEFLPAIQPGLSRADFMAQLQNALETRSNALMLETNMT